MKSLLLAMLLLLSSLLEGCASTQDCSVYSYPSTQMCSCLRGNEDSERARQCWKDKVNVMLQKNSLECHRACYRDDCSYCDAR